MTTYDPPRGLMTYDQQHAKTRESACCDSFRAALATGTDNEGYGPGIGTDENGTFTIGTIEEPLKACPWCSASLSP